ncbi:MAG: DUF3108 domain-containing protein [Winogradskyella sp.]|uniref:DUF3108 domain-containing protein n=1 Tax=Winogradskyella sp. TaxID=1883156 RepID=UPI0018512A95|nr:DUF3108 domain-containing protein [Winogradskyella sp.]MBT8243876.1 DUF3108 domain-containing protein [Winogradskyella sp.]NNK22281.1 DUF3108 domain-containing protein [Winogradskyella sp.]
MKHILVSISLFFCLSLFAQNKTIAFGEKLVYTASYNMSGLLTDIAQVTMETSKIKTSKSTLMRLKCSASTYSSFDSFFKIRDLYESYVSPSNLTPYLYKREIDEGGYYKFMQYKYRHKTKTVNSVKKKRRSDGTIWEEKKNVSINPGTKDLVATLYTLRNLDIDKANVGDSSSFKVLFDNEESTVVFKYLGKESISSNIGRKECYKIAITLKGSDALKGNNTNIIWLTADANKVPLLAKFKIPVGNGELKIKSATGLKH